MVSKKQASITRVRMAKPRDADRCSSERIFLSHPQIHDGFLYYLTAERDIRGFHPYACEISHIPIPARGKMENKKSHVDRTLVARRSVTSL